MILDSLTSVKAALSAATSSNPVETQVYYFDFAVDGNPSMPSLNTTTLAVTSNVTLLSAPTNNPRREVFRASIYNADTTTATVTVRVDSGTASIPVKADLATQETLHFEKGFGWYKTKADGSRA